MRKENQNRKPSNSSLLGLLIILFGVLLLIDNIIPGLYFLNRLISWPVILIACGLIIGHRSKYLNAASYVLIIIGVFFLVLRIFNIDFSTLFWPIILMAVGFALISGRRGSKRFFPPSPLPPTPPIWDKRVTDENDLDSGGSSQNHMGFKQGKESDAPDSGKGPKTDQEHAQDYDRDEYVDSTSVFSSNKINVVSKSFKGGNVVNIFAGTEINLMHADMAGPAVLEVTQLFGGSTIITPAHWVIQPEMAAIFGGIEDKRFTTAMPDSNKILYIRGTSLFGGITIKSI